MRINIGGVEIDFMRKKIKAMHIHVKGVVGKVSVTAPIHMDFAKINAFVLSKIDWIKKTQEKMTSKITQPILNYVDGEMVNAFGVDYKLVVFYNDNIKEAEEYVKGKVLDNKMPVINKNSVIFVPHTMMIVTNRGSTTAVREKLVAKRLETALLKLAKTYIAQYEPLMNVKVKTVLIKKMRGCWGKCQFKIGEIRLNRNLAKCPPKMTEYIVVHEMCHLLVANHSAEFKAVMTKFYPNWKKANVELNRYSFD